MVSANAPKNKRNPLRYLLYVIGGIAILFFALILFVKFFGGYEEVVCDPPYIAGGSFCCLDKNNNSVCDKTDEKIAYQSQARCGDGTCQVGETCASCNSDCGDCTGQIYFTKNVGDIRDEIFPSCYGGEGLLPWCEQVQGNRNEFNVYAKYLKEARLDGQTADFIYRLENPGFQEAQNIRSTLVCDETSPESNKRIITDALTSYKGVILSENYFNCEPCPEGKSCVCDAYKYGNVVLSLSNGEIDHWFQFDTSHLVSNITLFCSIQASSEIPSRTISTNLTIHFLADK